MTGYHKDNQQNSFCPRCGFNREPNTEECPQCGAIFAKSKSEYMKEVGEKQNDNLSEISKLDISKVKLDLSSGGKRNILYNLNTRAINLFLFAVTAIIAGILVFKYLLYLGSHG